MQAHFKPHHMQSFSLLACLFTTPKNPLKAPPFNSYFCPHSFSNPLYLSTSVPLSKISYLISQPPINLLNSPSSNTPTTPTPALQLTSMEQDNTNVGGSGNGRSSSYLCRQSSTRWIPTTDQIRILKDLYYNNGLRSPNADQIQRISARLRQYGKIEGKNVFYWFQNHKARERQKKRLTVDINSNKFNTNMSSTGVSPTSPVFYGLGQMGGSTGGAMLMERTYRECGAIESNMGWVETTAMPQFYYQSQQRPGANYYYEENYYYNNHQHQQQEEEKELVGIETLPLFPIHSNQEHNHQQQCYFQPYCLDQQRKDDTSLELTLNSYYSPHGSS